MKIPVLILLSAALAVVTPAMQEAHAAANSFEGTITDAMCTRKHMMPGKSDAECVKACAKEGSAYVLMSGGKMYTLAAKPGTLAAFAGKHVVVHGEAAGAKLTVASIEEVGAKK
jgi:hypothetical protein